MEHLQVDRATELRVLGLRDRDELFALVDANRAYLRRWLPWLDANTKPEHTAAFLEASVELAERGAGCVYGIVHEGELCGTAGFNWIDRVNRSCGVGYWVSEDQQGRGLVTASCRALIRHAFGKLGLNRVDIVAAVENHGSRAVAERLGFEQYGVVPEAEWLYDHFVDHAQYALTLRAYQKKEGGA